MEYTVQVIVTEEENARIFQRLLPEFLTGEKLLLVAVGQVEAGVDLDELEQDDVRVVGNTVTIDLPDARILGSSLDEEARRNAEDRIVESARENGIVEKAQNNAETSIRTFMTSMGYERIIFE